MRKGELTIRLEESIDSGSFHTFIIELASKEESEQKNRLTEALSTLHNNGQLDLNAEYSKLPINEVQDRLFILIDVYNDTIPLIDSKPEDIIDCITELTGKCDDEFSFFGTMSSFTEFCKQDLNRAKQALDYVLRKGEGYEKFIYSTILSANDKNIEWSITQVEKLASHHSASTRLQAFSAIACTKEISHHNCKNVVSLIEEAAEKEGDASVKAVMLRALTLLTNNNDALSEKAEPIIKKIINKPNPIIISEAARLLSFEKDENIKIPKPTLYTHLIENPQECYEATGQIDHLLANLLKKGENTTAEKIIEEILRAVPQANISLFRFFSNELIRNQEKSLHRLVTKWLKSGDLLLGRAVHDLIQDSPSNNIELSVDSNLIEKANNELKFLSRKAIGWLFTSPTSAASFVLSLHEHASTEVKKEINELFYELLLLSYTEEVREYLENIWSKKSEEAHSISKELTSRLDAYFEELKSASRRKELTAPEKNIELYWKEFGRLVEKAKDEGKKSIFEEICTVQHLLYGNTTISHIYDASGQAHRSEVPMQTVSHSSQLPRMTVIDPIGLDIQLRTFRLERPHHEVNS
ncbi:hypothetical protein [Halomonas sp. M4R1S46]|uniref:hypothetical protein n=1 Tax=Halomonas sp. M4R1S46 TaxID=2982692 RepID=UPI0021E46755|nr:hypothetical protein [Halomonas sp. M4R1S46]UYG06679.1 hypothetical protein OCT48_13735 [Halomonas sp. M4R1S46]